MRRFFTFLIFFLMLHQLNAQYVKPNHRENEKSVRFHAEKKNHAFIEASRRKLLVVLNEEDPMKVKELQTSEEKLKRYKALIRLSNKLLIDLVPQYWKQDNCQVEFKKYSECMALKKSGSKDYFTIDFSSMRQADEISELVTYSDPAKAREKQLNKPGRFGKFEIRLIEKFRGGTFYEFATISASPNELDFIIAIQQINNLFLAKYADHNLSTGHYESSVIEKHSYLSSRSLLIDSMQVNFGNGFYVKDLTENYPYKYQLSSSNEILNAIKSEDTSHAYLAIIPNLTATGKDNSYASTAGGGMTETIKDIVSSYTHYIIDAGSSEALFFARNQPRMVEKSGWQLNLTHALKMYNMKIIK